MPKTAQEEVVKSKFIGEAEKSQEQQKTRKTKIFQSEVPRIPLQKALAVAQAISDSYAKHPTKPLNIASALDMTPGSGHFRYLIGASAAYGLTEGAYKSDLISLTELGRRIVNPTEDGMEQQAKKEAFLKPRVIKLFLERYNNSKIPQEKIAKNVLQEMGVPDDSSEQIMNLIINGAKELGLVREMKGSLYVDLETIPASKSLPQRNEDEDESEDFYPEVLDDLKETKISPAHSDKAASAKSNRVFITHGKNKSIVNQLKEILTFGNFDPVVAEEHETISKPVPDKILDEMKSCDAAIIHVGKEIKTLDEAGNALYFINQNVLIEIGAAMALYGRNFILLVEEGTKLPSNLQGLYECRYSGDELGYQAAMKLLKAFNDFKSE